MDGRMRVKLGEAGGGECTCDVGLKGGCASVSFISRGFRLDEMNEKRKEGKCEVLPIASSSPFTSSLPPKTSPANFDLDRCSSVIRPSPTPTPPPLRRSRNGADDFCVAHFHVRGTVRGGLSADLGAQTAKLVPAPAVKAEKGERIGRGVEGHFTLGVIMGAEERDEGRGEEGKEASRVGQERIVYKICEKTGVMEVRIRYVNAPVRKGKKTVFLSF